MNAIDEFAFSAALLDASRRVPPGLTAWNGSDPARRFAVYRNNVLVSLLEALSSTFPVTRALVGEAFFGAMAREFVVASPPRCRVLAEYGGGLPDFIATFVPAAGLPWLGEVARIEALRVRAYHAADARRLVAEDFQPLLAQPERLAQMRVVLHPACCWLRTKYAAYSLWAAHQNVADHTAIDLGCIDVDTPQEVLIARPALAVHTCLLPRGGTDFLDALVMGQPLAAAVADTTAIHRDSDPIALLAMLIQQGLAVALDPVAGRAAAPIHIARGLPS